MIKYIIILWIGATIFLPHSIYSQSNITPLEQIDSLQKKEAKPLVVFIHTDWCRYCQGMKNTTFKNDSVASLLNKYFWFATLNGEEKQDIRFNETVFKYKPSGLNTGIHELAEQLGTENGKVSYPTLCILNAKYEIIFQYNQFISSEDLIKVLLTVIELEK